MEKIIEGLQLVDLIPRDRLNRYLNSTSLFLKMPLRILDLSGATVLELSLAAGPNTNEGNSCPPAAWAGVCDVMGDRPTGRMLDDGSYLMAAPIHYKNHPRGYLAACLNGKDGAGDLALPLLSLSASHLEVLAEAGFEVESLSGEVVKVYEELALIYGLTARLGAKVDIEEICRVVMNEAKGVLDPTDIIFQLADFEAGVFRTILASGSHEGLAAGFAPGLEEGLIGQAYIVHRSVLVCEVEEMKHHKPWPFPIRRLLAVPLMAEGNVIGMITATDKKNGNEFNSREEKLISAIASVAAIAIKNAQLYSEIKGLFEGFVDATVTAVESRDPTTAGHSKRVAALTVELAKKVSESDLPAFKGITFSREQLLELRYAGLLHDIGKVGVREFVLLKASKLPYGGIEEVRYRFDYIRLLKRFEILEKKHEVLLREGTEAYFKTIPGIDSMMALDLEELDRYQKLIEFLNHPQVLSKDLPEIDGLSEVAEKSYHGSDGKLHPYLTPFEFGYLNVLKGSLSPDERSETEMHVTHSFHFLSRIPWTANFPKIAEIVYTHHERMDGSGYPRGLKQNEIPLQARMIAVADTFDALTAWDRPYKKSVSAEKALFILEMESSEGRLDSQLVQLFRDEKVYKMNAGITSFKRNGSEV